MNRDDPLVQLTPPWSNTDHHIVEGSDHNLTDDEEYEATTQHSEDDPPIVLATFNARTINPRTRIQDLEKCMISKDIDVLTIVETRQIMQLGHESKDFFYVQSPPSKPGDSQAQGVLTIISKK